MLQTVSREQFTLVERSQQQLETLLLDGSLRPGDRLPSEKEMGLMLGVSRTVVREAVRQLVAKGLVETRTGSGIYVKKMGSKMVEEPMSWLFRSRVLKAENIVEVREVLEVKIAALAAERARPDDIEGIEKTVEAMKKSKISASEVSEADLGFHNELAMATGNLLFSVLSRSMNEVMRELHLASYRLDPVKSVETSVYHHSRILDRVKAHDIEGAKREMEAHLADSRDWTQRIAERFKQEEEQAPGAKSNAAQRRVN